MKNIYKKTFKAIFIFISTIITVLIIYFCSAYILSNITVNKDFTPSHEIDIYIATNGMHTDFIVPIQTDIIDWSDYVLYSDTKAKRTDYTYIAIGWGDKSFFIDVPSWENFDKIIAIKALLGMNGSAMHTTYMYQPIEHKNIKKITISKQQYQKLSNYLFDYFVLQDNQLVKIETDNTYGNSDAFYLASGRYSPFFTCNTWAAEGLKHSDLPAPMWTIFQEGIFSKY